ncbi:MAG: peptide deformylase [Sedimentisphaerales bacterium]|nr:peptide deformylase [Sedimentisphaerales bacterium]
MVDIDKCQITHYPVEVLGKRAKPVEQINDNIRQLVNKMIDIMIENKGVGLAAPQVGVDLRIFIISVDGTREKVRVYINPTVTPEGDLVGIEEGCLSVPGIYTTIKRYKECSVVATDINGKEFSDRGEGLYARALQHEYDHLEGITIINRMGQAARIVHRRQLKKLVEKHKRND